MISNKLNIFIPISITQIIEMFYRPRNMYNVLLMGVSTSRSTALLDVYEGKKFTLNIKSAHSNKFTLTKHGIHRLCTAQDMKINRSLIPKSCISHFNENSNYNGMLYFDKSLCRLVLYDSSQLKNYNCNKAGYVDIDALEIELPDLPRDSYDKMSLIYDGKRNSFYNIHSDAFYKLDMNMDNESIKWDTINDIKFKYPRNGAALLCHDDNLFLIDDGSNGTNGQYSRKIEMVNMKTKQVIELPDIMMPIDKFRCRQGNCVYVPQKNQIAVGKESVNILDVNTEKWTQYPQQIHFKIKVMGKKSRNWLWNDMNDCNIFYIATYGQCIEWMDIRENTNKFHILWKSSLRRWFYYDGSGYYNPYIGGDVD